MMRTFNPENLSRPTPWLTAAILLLIAAAAMVFGDQAAVASPSSAGPGRDLTVQVVLVGLAAMCAAAGIAAAGRKASGAR